MAEINKEKLYKLYIKDELPAKKCAEILCISRSAMFCALRKLGMKRSSRRLVICCDNCGKEKTINKYRTKNNAHHFCSRKCYGQWRSKNIKGDKNHKWKPKPIVLCDCCGKQIKLAPYKIKLSQKHFCNRVCSNRWKAKNLQGKDNYNWRCGGPIKQKLRHRTNMRIKIALKRNKAGHLEDILGYSLKKLENHLGKTMPKGYNWDDFLRGDLHIDHIVPVSAFNFNHEQDIDFKRCWALKNLQLLPAIENMRKSAKLTKPFQPSLSFAPFSAGSS